MGRWGLAATRSAPDTHSHDRPPQPRSSTPPFFSLSEGFTVTGLGRDGPPLSASMVLAMKAQGGASPGLPSGFHRPTNEPKGLQGLVMRFHSALVTRLHGVSLAQCSHSSTLGPRRTQSSPVGFVSDKGGTIGELAGSVSGCQGSGLGVCNTNAQLKGDRMTTKKSARD